MPCLLVKYPNNRIYDNLFTEEWDLPQPSGEHRLLACSRRQPADDTLGVGARYGIEHRAFGKLPKGTGLPRRIRPVADWQPVLPRA